MSRALFRDRLVGTFRLVSLETRRSNGQVDRPMGDHPIGLFMGGLPDDELFALIELFGTDLIPTLRDR